MEKLEKATIEVLAGRNAGTRLHVLFNPTEYSFERSNTYKVTQVPGLGTPLLQFINGECDQLSMELFLDDLTDPDGPVQPAPGGRKSVQRRIEDLYNLLEIDSDLHAPPQVRFAWGPLQFDAVIEKLSRKVTLFRPDGTPARATLSATFKEYRPIEQQVIEPRRESSDKSKRRQIIGSDNIYLLAAREYDDVTRWRVIAAANDLDDPREVAAGDWVLVPPLEDDDGSRGRL
jgi:nucleoid-associated protein YgaU